MDSLILLIFFVMLIFAVTKIYFVSEKIEGLERKLWWLYKEIESLKATNTQLSTALKSKDEKQVVKTDIQPDHETPKPQAAPTSHPDLPPSRFQPTNRGFPTVETSQIRENVYPPTDNPQIPPIQNQKGSTSIEKEIGARLPAWIGATALILAGFFLVKYTIDVGLLTPPIRVGLGLLFGGLLLASGIFFRIREQIANYIRISQALSGSGIAVLFLSIYAANQYYQLIPYSLAFLGLTLVTVAAVFLSLLHGLPIAVLGIVSGFLTPAALKSVNPQASVLFMYLLLLNMGLSTVINNKKWWQLQYGITVANCFWILQWLQSSPLQHADFIWITIFLVAVNITVFLCERPEEENPNDVFSLLSFQYDISDLFSIGLSLILFSGMIAYYRFELNDWFVFGLVTAAVIFLARLRENRFGLVPYLALTLTDILLLIWNSPDDITRFTVTSGFALLFAGSGLLLQWYSREPRIWAGLVSASTLSLYFLTFMIVGRESGDHYWAGVSMLITLVMLLNIIYLFISKKSTIAEFRNILLAIYFCTFTTFLTTALLIETPRDFMPIVIAIEMAVAAFVYTRLHIATVRWLVMALCTVFLVIIFPQILFLLELSAFSILEHKIDLVKSLPLVKWPAFQLGLPAIMFFLAAFQLRTEYDDNDVSILELICISLTGLMGYYINRHLFHSDNEVLFAIASFTERGITTNAFFLFGLVCLVIGNKYLRKSCIDAGIVLSLISLFRIVFFDYLKYNPLWRSQNVGSMVIFNSLLINYGLPAVWTLLLTKLIKAPLRDTIAVYLKGFILFLIFTLVSLNVRQYFQGSDLSSRKLPTAEIYAYSVAWIIMGIILIIVGTYYRNRELRIASLVLMLLSIVKVFVYDASELDGILRVMAFLGLGLSLLGLSWFYTKFVFRNDIDSVSDKNI